MEEYVNIHTHKPKDYGLQVVNAPIIGDWPSGDYFSFGLHPWHIGRVDEEMILTRLEELCLRKQIVAVGEIGLDRTIETPLSIQKDFFLKQLKIANKYELPIIIHSVRTNSDLLQVIKGFKGSGTWIFHGFNGSMQDARQLVDKQCFLSFGEVLLRNKKIQNVLKETSLDNVFFETDDSDEKISTIYKKGAEILDICIPELKSKIYSNFIKVFAKPWRKIG